MSALSSSDSELLEQAKTHFDEERLLQAARLLRQVEDKSLLSEQHRKWLHMANVVEDAVGDLLSQPNGEWTKQGESHGRYDTSIYYKVDSAARLTCRLESPIPSSLLVPLLSVLNESSLYHTWIPSWKNPISLGVRLSKQLLNDTRGHQIIQVQCDVPWPMAAREVLLDVTAVDDIDENGFIIAKMRTLEETGDKPTNFTLPPLEPNMERIEFDGAVLFRACPPDHPNLADAQKKFNEDVILLQLSMFLDAHVEMVPQSMINFVTRTVIGHIWNMLLSVAEQVRDGTRTDHCQEIQRKEVFYKWVEERCRYMQKDMQANSCKEEEDESWTLEDVLRLSL